MQIRTSSSRWLLGVVIVVAALAVLSVAITLLRGPDDVDLRDPATPEGTVQLYLIAMIDRDFALAYSYLHPDLRNECTESDFRNQAMWFEGQANTYRVRHVTTRQVHDEIEVEVRITQTYGEGPFGGENTFTEYFRIMATVNQLGRFGGEWRLTRWPWPVGNCFPRDAKPVPPAAGG
ncbi:MAG: hypothetical protein FJ318_00125 [SAR202 cluster bacterium]|nr:hypothetical protein [SAR202 cluster bacterium]